MGDQHDRSRDQAAGPDNPVPQFVENSSLLRQAFFDRYFRFAAVVVLLVLALAGLMLPRHFTSTPEGVVPVYKMRGIDKLQAWSLARSARAKIAAGHVSDAMLAWQSAIANDPGDARLSRELVQAVLAQPSPRKEFLPIGVRQSLWLMNLTRTNSESLELTVALCEKYGLDDYVIAFLAPQATNLTSVQAAYFLKALYHQGRMDQFGDSWAIYRDKLATDPGMQIYLAAWQAGWGPPGTIRIGRERLDAARADAASRSLANRLALPIAFSRSDPEAYRAGLEALVDDHADKVSDHLDYWRLLILAGQAPRAAELARGFSRPPETPADVQRMIQTLVDLGMQSYAAQLLERHLPTFAFRPDLWALQADLLIALQQWTELRALAVDMRQSDFLRGDLAGFAWFLEALSELRTGRKEPAYEAFTRAAEAPTTDPLLSYRASTQLAVLGYPALASRLLSSLEKTYGGLAGYWLAVVGAAYEARQFDTMRAAAARGYELAPDQPVFVSNYAAMLLMQRTNPPLAIQLTMKALTAEPNAPAAQLNHLIALIQNERLVEAEQLLATIKIDELDARYVTMRNYAAFDLHTRRGNQAAALEAFNGIEVRFLFAPQLRWLDETYLRLTGQKRPDTAL
jgi:hypothetical protein